MARYYVVKRAQANGDHEVHHEYCAWLPSESNRLPLGQFDDCRDAIAEAKKHYEQTNGCARCCLECHAS